jgi:nucleotide-binding universal stress UspA family protein
MKKLSIRNVLVPIDFSTISIQTIETAKRLAHRFDASIHLVHVHHWQYPGDFMGSLMPVGKVRVSFEQHRRKRLAEELKMMAQAHGLSPGLIHPLEGASAFHEICRLAQQIPADLIVMPTHGYTGLRHVLLGSTAERVVRHSPCPVFIVREKKQRSKTGRGLSISTILVPVDFSSSSRQGLQYAIGFADEFAARMILLHAVYLGYIYSSEETPIDIPLLQKTARENAEHQMHKLERTVNFGSAKFETMFTEGSPVQDICAFAKDHDTDLIITSTHGLTGLKRVLIGSIAEKVVRHAPCSVLVVPSNPKIRLANLAKRPARR